MFVAASIATIEDVVYEVATPLKQKPKQVVLEEFCKEVIVLESPVKDDSRLSRQQVLPTGKNRKNSTL
jgi:hypothetical protein